MALFYWIFYWDRHFFGISPRRLVDCGPLCQRHWKAPAMTRPSWSPMSIWPSSSVSMAGRYILKFWREIWINLTSVNWCLYYGLSSRCISMCVCVCVLVFCSLDVSSAVLIMLFLPKISDGTVQAFAPASGYSLEDWHHQPTDWLRSGADRVQEKKVPLCLVDMGHHRPAQA